MNASERLERLKQQLEDEMDKYVTGAPTPSMIQAYAAVVMALTKTYGLV